MNNKEVNVVLQSSKIFIPYVSGICLNDTDKRFYGVSSSTDYNNKIFYTSNGLDWDFVTITNLSNTEIYHWNAIACTQNAISNDLCAVGINYAIISSNKGMNWTRYRISPTNVNIEYDMVYWSSSEKKYYALSTSTRKYSTSSDGIIWTTADMSVSFFNSINSKHFTYSWTINTVLANIVVDTINSDGTGNSIDTSKWFDEIYGPFAIIDNATTNDYTIINYDQTEKVFTVIKPNNIETGLTVTTNKYTTNYDHDIAYTEIDKDLVCAAYLPFNKTVYGITNKNEVYSSVNCYSWNYASVVPVSSPITDVLWIDKFGAFCAIAANGQNVLSSNGLGWTKGNQISKNTLRWGKICWSEKLNLLVAIIDKNISSNYVAVSNDGRNWEIEYLDSEYKILDVIWVEKLNKFIAISSVDTTILSSNDGYSWKKETFVGNNVSNFVSVTWSELLSKVIIATNNRAFLYVSEDLINWDVLQLPVTDFWYSAKWMSINCLSIIGENNLLYTSDLINFEILDNNLENLAYPIELIEFKPIYKCLVINK